MTIGDGSEGTRNSNALERARNLSQALADAARRARLSTRLKKKYVGGGFQARQGAAFVRYFVIGSFVLMVVLPTFAAALYFGVVASNQYIAEARFTVSGGEIPKIDSIGALTGLPAVAIIQDTQIVTNYIESRAAVEKLDSLIHIRRLYSIPDADWYARFNPDNPIEKFVKYWNHMVDVSIKMPSGIVDLRVRAFTPQDSVRIARTVLEISEDLINDLNARMNRDAVADAAQQLDRASAHLLETRVAFENARNDEGILDATKTADALNDLITKTRGALLLLQQEYASERKYVLESAPQMRNLKNRIDTTAAQIVDLEAKLTSTKRTSEGQTLAASMTRFSELDLEQKIAERLYAGAAASLELAKAVAGSKAMYLNAFVQPVTPEELQYPRRLLFTSLVLISSIAIWGACCGLIALVRNYMA